MRTFTNDRAGKSVSTDLTNEQIAAQFAEVARDDSWLWFWMVDTIQKAEKAPAFNNAIAFIGDSFLFAIGMGLKKPMIRAQFDARRFKLYLSRRGTLCFKSGAVEEGTKKPIGDEEYLGCLYRGAFLPNRDRTILPSEQEFISRLQDNPVDFLAECSRDMDRCCYCDKALSDDRSKLLGYGKICAGKWGLPWKVADYTNKVPSFADMWKHADTTERRNVRGMMLAIRESVRDETLWAILGDALQEAGWSAERLPTAPKNSVIVPAV